MQARKGLGVAVLLVNFILASVFLPACSNVTGNNSTIWEGIEIASIPVGGLTPEEAQELLEQKTEAALLQPVEFRLGERAWRSNLQNLGIKLDIDSAVSEAYKLGQSGIIDRIINSYRINNQGYSIPLSYLYDEGELSAAIMRLTAEFDTKSAQSTIVVGADGELSLIEGKSGHRINSQEAARQLIWRLQSGYPPPESVHGFMFHVSTERVTPTLNGQTLKEIGVDALLSSFTTRFNASNYNRTFNIKVAADALNQHIVKPGELFSFNQIVGPRSEETGYKEALVILKNEFVPGVGGGVCQVSSTLYNALLRANIPVAERHNHSLPVDYVQLGSDATVNYNSKDLKFINDTPYSLVIQATVERNTLTFQIFGKKRPIPKITIYNEIVERLPPKRVEKPNPELPIGQEVVETKGQSGARVKLYRLIEENGSKKRELISYDTYRPLDEVVQVGTKTLPAGHGNNAPHDKTSTGADVSNPDPSANLVKPVPAGAVPAETR